MSDVTQSHAASETLHIRVDRWISEALRDEAKRAGVSLTAVARRLLGGFTQRPIDASPTPPGLVLPPDLQEEVLAFGRRRAGGLEVTLESAVVELLCRALREARRGRKGGGR